MNRKYRELTKSIRVVFLRWKSINIMHFLIWVEIIAIEEGLRFAIREGGRTVGSGVVSKING